MPDSDNEIAVRSLEARLRFLEAYVFHLMASVGANDPVLAAVRSKLLHKDQDLRGILSVIREIVDNKGSRGFAVASADSNALDERLANLQGQLNHLRQNVDEINDRVASYFTQLTNQTSNFRRQHAVDLMEIAEGAALFATELRRFVPVAIYVTPHVSHPVGLLERSVLELLRDHLDCEIYLEGEPKISSWYKDLFGRTRTALTSDEVRERVAKLEHAIELQKIDVVQSQVDGSLAKAVNDISKALRHFDEGNIQIGSLLISKALVKGRSRLSAVSLNSSQMIKLAREPKLVSLAPHVLREVLELPPDETVAPLDLEDNKARESEPKRRRNKDIEPG